MEVAVSKQAWTREPMTKFNAKLMIVRNDGVYFAAGVHTLVDDPESAEVFTDLEVCLDRIRDVITLGLKPVTQIRIISTEFVGGKQ